MSENESPPSFLCALRSREEVAEGTMAFHFERPPGFLFKAGQSSDVTLVDPPETDAEGNTRAFSIASPPAAPEIVVATRLRDTAFKRVLRSVPLGTVLRFAAPGGSMTLHHDAKRPAVILTGGIGITPFRSIVHQAALEKLPHRIFLFFSNLRPEVAPFLDELAALERVNPNFRFIPTMDGMAGSRRAWTGETGRIDHALLARHLTNAPSPVYYTAGPPGLVAGVRKMLNEDGVDDDDIRSEEFSGY